jgi:cellobiose-specific phosphotransferase system component IIC
MFDKERVALIANYCTILSLPIALIALVLAAIGPIYQIPTKSSDATRLESHGSARPTPFIALPTENRSHETTSFWWQDFVTRFLANLSGAGSLTLLVIAIALFITGWITKRRIRKPPV